MSLNAIHRNVMVFSDDESQAIKKLNELVSNEEIIKRNKNFVETKQGTYQARKFSEGCRGYRYKEVHVDESLKNNQDAMFLIKVKLVPPDYYAGTEKDEYYKVEDHIHFFKSE